MAVADWINFDGITEAGALWFGTDIPSEVTPAPETHYEGETTEGEAILFCLLLIVFLLFFAFLTVLPELMAAIGYKIIIR